MAGSPSQIRVPVACGWRSPDAPRDMDAPALGATPDIPAWLAGMADDDKRGLVGRLETQVLMGEAVMVQEKANAWARVSVPDQPATAAGAPYACWIPVAQLADPGQRLVVTERVATVVGATAKLVGAGSAQHVSFGTALPVLEIREDRAVVALPGGTSGWIAAAEVAVHAHDAPARVARAASVLAAARAFVGLPYLWAGRSGFGFDCSGLIQLVHRVHGITLPRDTGPMSEAGSLVDPVDRRAGDLLFFERDGDIHHVVMWIGDGLVVESPKTGLAVRVIELDRLPYADEVTLTRRILPA
jgi:gamma-D-glutamyl-L-lysine dipeptidyl-peptidase